MAGEPNAVEQAVSRTLRDNLGRIQETAEEVRQAIHDLVSACASNRPTNTLPSMLRAQTSAASLSAVLEVLSRFVTSTAMQSSWPSAAEPVAVRSIPYGASEPATARAERIVPESVGAERVEINRQVDINRQFERQFEQPVSAPAHPIEWQAETSPAAPPQEEIPAVEPVTLLAPVSSQAIDAVPAAAEPPAWSNSIPIAVEPTVTAEVTDADLPADANLMEAPEPHGASLFSLDSLPLDEQELHKRAYRVAKVSMQDIKMLHPDDVRLGRENKDLCLRLREDIEKARKEYDRRFEAVQFHSADYFYDWMVEILAGGNPEALGEYPYPTPALRH